MKLYRPTIASVVHAGPLFRDGSAFAGLHSEQVYKHQPHNEHFFAVCLRYLQAERSIHVEAELSGLVNPTARELPVAIG